MLQLIVMENRLLSMEINKLNLKVLKKIGIIDAIKEETGIDALSLNESELREAKQKIGIINRWYYG